MAITIDGAGTITGLTAGAGVAASALSGQVPDANAPSGSVIQVVQSIKTDAVSVTGNSFVDLAGLSANITPSFASSKILVMLSIHVGMSQDTFPLFRLMRQSTNIGVADVLSPGTAATFAVVCSQNTSRDRFTLVPGVFNFFDSPNTTSSTTYKIQGNPRGASGSGFTIFINRMSLIGDANQGTASSTITLMEIAG